MVIATLWLYFDGEQEAVSFDVALKMHSLRRYIWHSNGHNCFLNTGGQQQCWTLDVQTSK